MGTFYDGTTDSLQSQFHASIQWTMQYNRIIGSCPDTPLFRQVVPSAVVDGKPQEAGKYEIYSPITNQNQKLFKLLLKTSKNIWNKDIIQ